MHPTTCNSVLRFGIFEYEPQNGILRKRGKPVQLPPQPARILSLLVSRPGQLITREELCQQIWDKHTFVDFEHGLNFGVRRIRTALHDNAKKTTVCRDTVTPRIPFHRHNRTGVAQNGDEIAGRAPA